MAITIDTVNKIGPQALSASAPSVLMQFPLTLDNSYPAGGYEIDISDLGYVAGGFRVLNGSMVSPGVARIYTKWDHVNSKLICESDVGVEIVAAVDLSLYVGQMEVVRY